MSNQDNSPNGPVSPGVIAPDWDTWWAVHGHAFGNQPGAEFMGKFMFYTGYLSCYNRMVQALRSDPETLALVTRVMADELNVYFQQPNTH